MKSQHTDHVTPTLWKGDVTVNTVTLLTCWKDGHTLASSLDLEVEMALDSLASMSNIDMLSPLGALIIKLDAQLPSTAVDDTLELEDEDDVQDATLPTVIHTGETINSSSGTEVELDLEDMITSETNAEQQEPSHSISHYLTIQARDGTEKKVHKSRALKVLFNEIVNTKGSMDHQKHIQGLTRYSVKMFTTMDGVNADDSIFGESICVGDPAVTIVAVEHMVFLAVIQVSSIRASNVDSQHVPVSILSEDSMLVGFHILMLKSTMLHEGDEDWIWAHWDLEHAGGKTKGKYIQPVSPTLWLDKDVGCTMFIFTKTKLQELTASLVATIGKQGLPELTRFSRTASFPYRSTEGEPFSLLDVLD